MPEQTPQELECTERHVTGTETVTITVPSGCAALLPETLKPIAVATTEEKTGGVLMLLDPDNMMGQEQLALMTLKTLLRVVDRHAFAAALLEVTLEDARMQAAASQHAGS